MWIDPKSLNSSKMHVWFDGIVTSPTWKTSSAPSPPPKKKTQNFEHWILETFVPPKFPTNSIQPNQVYAENADGIFSVALFSPTDGVTAEKKTGRNRWGPGVQSHSHSQVWEVADDIHVGGVHRSFNFQAVVGSVLLWVQWDFTGGGDLQGLAVYRFTHGMSVYVSKVCYPPVN